MGTTRHGCSEHQCKETEGAPVLEPGAIVLARQGQSRDSKRVYYEDVQGVHTRMMHKVMHRRTECRECTREMMHKVMHKENKSAGSAHEEVHRNA